ncbi:hypothetical protein SNOG_13557 [Parastagonospora nodorum SN15]|uniref:Uncharacterized protein n=1 Tax=Phaeosphaeria nodorum (strain SN15 / ATCC MYA-4574 / FGSC 10173) TaxID=321614 RepID=Q0U3V7_PHANO|nr:hypothetical protein SNOG_13557 [Parastagonospora nodorum SN15]EAT79004.1 hypothetical protein SNOG_13557 [Parastagonospora nodorum SN15]
MSQLWTRWAAITRSRRSSTPYSPFAPHFRRQCLRSATATCLGTTEVLALLLTDSHQECAFRLPGALSALRRLDDGGGGYAASAATLDRPGSMSLTPGTKAWRFAGRRPMPDHIAFWLGGVVDEWMSFGRANSWWGLHAGGTLPYGMHPQDARELQTRSVRMLSLLGS